MISGSPHVRRPRALARVISVVTIVACFFTCAVLPAFGSNQSLQIKVHDSAGKPISGATIAIKLDGGHVQTEKTDAEGKASFSNLPPGDLKYSVLKGGFQPLEDQALSIDVDSPAGLDIMLVPKIEV